MSDPNNNPYDSLARISEHVYAPPATYGGQQPYNSQPSVGMSQPPEDTPRGPISPNVKGSTKPKPPPDLSRGQMKPNTKGTTRPPPPPPQTRGIPAQPLHHGGSYPQPLSNPVYSNPSGYYQQPPNTYPDPSTQPQFPVNYSYNPPLPNPYGGHSGQAPFYSQGQSPPPGPPPGGFWMPPQGGMYPPAAGPPQGGMYPPPATGHPQGGYPGPYPPPMDSTTRSDGSYTSGVGGFVAPRNPQ